MSGFHWRNGEIVEGDIPSVSMADSAHLYGDATFTMLRTFGGRTFKLVEHAARLAEGMRALSIPWPTDFPDVSDPQARECRLIDAHESVVEMKKRDHPEVEEWRTVITASRGLVPIYGEPEPWITIHAYPLRWVLKGKSHLYDGVDAVVAGEQLRGVPATVKHHARIHFRLAERAAGHDKVWPIVTWGGALCEAPGANVALVFDKEIYTPAEGCLRGISMGWVENFCARDARSFHRGYLSWPVEYLDDQPTEAFFTCTPFSILPIRSIDGRELECPGPVTKRITEAWIEAVGVDFIADAKRWDAEA